MIIHLDPNKKEALYSQLYQAIKDQIHSGHLAAHQKLPSKRQLAKDLGMLTQIGRASCRERV